MQPQTNSSNGVSSRNLTGQVAIVTGAARRIGSVTASKLHAAGANLVIHYGSSASGAQALIERLNADRSGSAVCQQADLNDDTAADAIVGKALDEWGQLNILVNNASSFYPTPVGTIKGRDIDNLFATNFRAPLLLAQSATPHLRKNNGCIVNMIDIHAYRPHAKHPVYCAAKAALLSATRSLALDLAPDVRVNGIAPGSILWPEGAAELNPEGQASILAGIPLQRNGNPDDIANTIAFLCSSDANYITGQIIAVDGGRSL